MVFLRINQAVRVLAFELPFSWWHERLAVAIMGAGSKNVADKRSNPTQIEQAPCDHSTRSTLFERVSLPVQVPEFGPSVWPGASWRFGA